MPPNSARATRVVRAPKSAARRAARTPAGPAPITRTFVISLLLFCASLPLTRLLLAARLSRLSLARCCATALAAQSKELEQNLVFVLCELLHGPRSGLLQDAFGDRLLEIGRDGWIPEGVQQRGQPGEHAFKEMLDPARPAGEVKLQIGTHDAPAESRPPTHGIVRVADTQHALLDEIQDLFVESHLEPVRNVAGDFLVEADGLLSDGFVERDRLFDRRGCGLGAAHHLNQRNDVRWIERVADQATLRALHAGLNDARR